MSGLSDSPGGNNTLSFEPHLSSSPGPYLLLYYSYTLSFVLIRKVITSTTSFIIRKKVCIYADKKIQKGFMRNVAGCIEHSETVYQMLRDAHDCKQPICVSWIDLTTAYGSVKHALCQFSLEWYHVPEHLCQSIFNYYEGLIAVVMVKPDRMAWFRLMIGVFRAALPQQSCSMWLLTRAASIWINSKTNAGATSSALL